MTLYQLMDWLDFFQPQIEVISNVFIGLFLLAFCVWWIIPKEKLTSSWSKASKTIFGEEIRKHG